MLIQKTEKNIFTNYSSSIVRPSLIRLASNLIVASFELMKLIPAKYVIKKAIDNNFIDPNCPVIETSSGTYALGLAITCSELGIPFFVVSDSVINEELQNRLKYLGGEVQIITSDDGGTDIQKLRLDYLYDYLKNNKGSFWPAQYYNIDNRLAYSDFANFLLENIGDQFTLVGSVGSGGSTSGTTERLRENNCDIELIGVDTFGSILFGLDKGERKLRGLGNSILPDNLVHKYYDQIHWLTAECAYKATRELYSQKALFCGPTTGAAYHVAKWLAANEKDKVVVFIAPDSGYRYVNTVYNNNWLKTNNMNLNLDLSQPQLVSTPKLAMEPWSYLDWNRRTYNEVKNEL